jgi:hypothetical protein
MDRRDFIALWFQALLMAIFPSLRQQPELSKKLGFEMMLRTMKDCPIYAVPVIEQTRWTIYGPIDQTEIERVFGEEISLF